MQTGSKSSYDFKAAIGLLRDVQCYHDSNPNGRSEGPLTASTDATISRRLGHLVKLHLHRVWAHNGDNSVEKQKAFYRGMLSAVQQLINALEQVSSKCKHDQFEGDRDLLSPLVLFRLWKMATAENANNSSQDGVNASSVSEDDFPPVYWNDEQLHADEDADEDVRIDIVQHLETLRPLEDELRQVCNRLSAIGRPRGKPIDKGYDRFLIDLADLFEFYTCLDAVVANTSRSSKADNTPDTSRRIRVHIDNGFVDFVYQVMKAANLNVGNTRNVIYMCFKRHFEKLASSRDYEADVEFRRGALQTFLITGSLNGTFERSQSQLAADV
jgi:hypothetical protein